MKGVQLRRGGAGAGRRSQYVIGRDLLSLPVMFARSPVSGVEAAGRESSAAGSCAGFIMVMVTRDSQQRLATRD